jgi:RNA polymerase sigma-70 factor (ECF subfamily)
MGGEITPGSEIAGVLKRAAAGDRAAVSQLLAAYRERLKAMVALRLDQRLRSRVDASDVVQEALVEADRRFADYAKQPAMDFYLWLRQLAVQKLIDLHRHHVGAKKRSVGNEISIYQGAVPEASSASLAHQLLGKLTSPTQAIRKAELQLKVQESLNDLDPVDREVLALRHFEQLSNEETAHVLGLSRSGASKRYIIALGRLRERLRSLPEFGEWAGEGSD